MNVFELIVDGIKKIFSGPNVLFKHISLFALVGISSVVQTHFELLKETLSKGPTAVLPDFTTVIGGIVIMVAISIYFSGYSLRFMHNAYNDYEDNILPEIDEKPIGTFFKAFPLIFVWVLWIILTYIVGIIPIIGWIGLIVMFFIWYPFIQFVFIAYAKDFNRKGLFRYTFPIDCMKHSFGTVFVCGLAFILLWIIALIPCVIILFTFALGENSNSTLSTYLCGILIGYSAFIIQMIWIYCAVQIYREKILPEIED